MIQDSIPLFEPYIGYEEKKAIDCVLESKQLSRGPWVEQFEYEFAAYVGKKYAIAVNSGTSGLHLCVKAAGWQEMMKSLQRLILLLLQQIVCFMKISLLFFVMLTQ